MTMKKIINVFAEYTQCDIQSNDCPCNTCIHNMPEDIDYQHIVWLMLLGMRGDYDLDFITKSIKEELNK